MRQLANSERIARFMRTLGAAAESDGACYFAGGATAVLIGWRRSTIDVDIRLVPKSDGLLRAIQRLKEELEINGSWPGRTTSSPYRAAGRAGACSSRRRGG